MRPAATARLAAACLAMAACATWAQRQPGAEAQVRQIVVEDEAVRIDELRVRGQAQRITVTPKRGAKAYEIVPSSSARDPSQRGAEGLAGQRVWSVFSF